MSDLTLTKLSETVTTVTLGWTPPPACRGYRFEANGKRSSTLDGTRSSVKFAKPGPYKVEALGTLASGVFPPPPVPPPSSVETITPAQFAVLVKPGAVIRDKKVSGAIGWSVPDVTLINVEFDTVDLNPGADGAQLLGVTGRAFYVWGVNGWLIGQDSVFDGKGVTADCKLWDKDGVVGRDWTVADSTFRNYFVPNIGQPGADHCQAIFVGSSLEGTIVNNRFDNNGNTAHVFVSTWGYNAYEGKPVTVPSVVVKGNTFGDTHGAYFAVNVHSGEIPLYADVFVEPGQPSVKKLCSNDAFVRVAP